MGLFLIISFNLFLQVPTHCLSPRTARAHSPQALEVGVRLVDILPYMIVDRYKIQYKLQDTTKLFTVLSSVSLFLLIISQLQS